MPVPFTPVVAGLHSVSVRPGCGARAGMLPGVDILRAHGVVRKEDEENGREITPALLRLEAQLRNGR